MTVNRRAIVSVAIGLGLALGGCSRSPIEPTNPGPPPAPPSPSARVAVSLSGEASRAPDRLGHTFTLHFEESGGVGATISSVACEFDVTLGSSGISGDKLPQNRRVPANGTLDVELTCPSPWGAFDETTVWLLISLADDNGHGLMVESAAIKLSANPD